MSAFGLRGRTVWLLSSLDWDAPWQPAHEVAARLARANDVTFVETTGRRLPRPADTPRLVRRLRRRRPVLAANGLRVVAPRVLPFPSSRRAASVNADALLRMLGDAAEPPLVWALLPSLTLLALLDRVPEAQLVYHCLLDFPALPHAPRRTAAVESAVVARASVVAADSATLLHDRGWRGAHVAWLPSGADVEPFAAARLTGVVADDVAALPRPVAGFAGSVDHRVDTALVAAAAARAPDWSFAFVGPVDRPRRRALSRIPNVHLLEPRPHDELPRALAGFDVGLVPYADDAARRTTFPAKLFEYLGAGLPVVATPLPDLDGLGGDVRLVAGAEELVAALTSCDRSPAAQRRRIELARANDWSVREHEWERVLAAAGVTA